MVIRLRSLINFGGKKLKLSKEEIRTLGLVQLFAQVKGLNLRMCDEHQLIDHIR